MLKCIQITSVVLSITPEIQYIHIPGVDLCDFSRKLHWFSSAHEQNPRFNGWNINSVFDIFCYPFTEPMSEIYHQLLYLQIQTPKIIHWFITGFRQIWCRSNESLNTKYNMVTRCNALLYPWEEVEITDARWLLFSLKACFVSYHSCHGIKLKHVMKHWTSFCVWL